MRQLVSSVSMRGVVVIGEGEDQAPMLYNGEEVGNGRGPACNVAGAIAAGRPESGTDLLIGIGGTPEGITSPPPSCDAWAEPCKRGWRRPTTPSARRPSVPATTSTAS